MTVRKDSDALAALAEQFKEISDGITYFKMRYVSIFSINDLAKIIEMDKTAKELVEAASEESSPTKTLKQVADEIEAKADELRDEMRESKEDGESDFYVYGWKADGMRLALAMMKHAILTTSTDETDGRTG